MKPNLTYKSLLRSNQQHLLGGVCSGIAEYFNIDPTWVRIAFLISTVFFIVTPIIYAILWMFIPAAPGRAQKLTLADLNNAESADESNSNQALIAPIEKLEELGELVDIDEEGPLPPLADMLSNQKTAQKSPVRRKPTTSKPAATQQNPRSQRKSPRRGRTSAAKATTPPNPPADLRSSLDDEDLFPSDFLKSLEEDFGKPADSSKFGSQHIDNLSELSDNPLAELEAKLSRYKDTIGQADKTQLQSLMGDDDDFPSNLLRSLDDDNTRKPQTPPGNDPFGQFSDDIGQFPSEFLSSLEEQDTTINEKPKDNVTHIPKTSPSSEPFDKFTDDDHGFPTEFLESFKEDD